MSMIRVVSAMILVLLLSSHAAGATQETPDWNAPSPTVRYMPFPTEADIAARKVVPSDDERSEGTRWIAALLTSAALPKGFESQMLTLKDGIEIRSRDETSPEKSRMLSGFLLKYRIPGYAVQVVETRCGLFVGFVELSDAPARTSQEERTAFVLSVAGKFLRAPAADTPTVTEHGSLRTQGEWLTWKKVTTSDGRAALQPLSNSGSFTEVRFTTDGKTVFFQVVKDLAQVRDHDKPRFAAISPRSESTGTAP